MNALSVVAVVAFLLMFAAGVVVAARCAVVKKRWRTILLDADGTLFDFDRSEEAALKETFTEMNLPYGDTTHAVYHKNNDRCWKALERAEMTRDELKETRFRDTFRDLSLDADPKEGSRIYETNLAKYQFPFPGAEDLCAALAKKYALYIVTNGLKNVQTAKLARTTVPLYVKGIYISEAIGVAKPAAEFFDAIFREHPECNRATTLIVGDSLTSDIRGGNNAGIGTCWLNREGEPRPDDLRIDYEIRDIRDLRKIL